MNSMVNVQDMLWAMLGLIAYAVVTGSLGNQVVHGRLAFRATSEQHSLLRPVDSSMWGNMNPAESSSW